MSNDSRGGFGGGRGGFGFGPTTSSVNDDNFGFSNRAGFNGSIRGTYNRDTDNNFDRGSYRGGRGRGFTPSSDFDNQDNNGQPNRDGFGGGRGAFGRDNSNEDNIRGRFGDRRGAFNHDNGIQDGARGGFGGGRGGFGFGPTMNSDNGINRGHSNRAGFNGANRGNGFDRGGYRGGRGGGFTPSSDFDNQQNNGQINRGGFGDRRGAFNRDNETRPTRGGRGGFGNENGFGQTDSRDTQQHFGFTAARGDFGRRGNFNQNDDDQRNRGGRGGRGRNSTDTNQENDGFASRGFGNNARGYSGNNQNGSGRNNGMRGGNSAAGFGRHEHANAEHDGDEYGERGPLVYIPTARNTDALFAEDRNSATLYANVLEHDEDVEVLNFEEAYFRLQKWDDAELDSQVLENVKERSKYGKPRKIQAVSIPFILDGYDIKSQGETGSGKTGAYLIPLIDRCMKDKKSVGDDHFESEVATPYAVVILPTRELCLQVYEQATKFAYGTGVTIAKTYGKYKYEPNVEELCVGCDILVGTPGRLKHFIGSGEIRVKKIRILVLDEADRLCDEEFYGNMLDIINTSGFPGHDKRQTLMFSATFPPVVVAMANRLLMENAVFITNNRSLPNKRIQQEFIVTASNGKLDKLLELLKAEAAKTTDGKLRRTLVFVNTKRMTDMGAMFLCQKNIPATSINGDRNQKLREEAISQFRTHKVSVLVSTDVCARGIDVKELDHVINMDLPNDPVIYLHRIGRTGRICPGFSTSFVLGNEPLLKELAEMFDKSGDPIPETLQTIIAGNGEADKPTAAAAAKDPTPENVGVDPFARRPSVRPDEDGWD